MKVAYKKAKLRERMLFILEMVNCTEEFKAETRQLIFELL
jgi:hypothetical protein